MTRRQVLVQLDDELVAALDQLAQVEGVSRSELLRRGARAVLDAAAIAAADRQLVDAYRRQPQDVLLTEALAAQAATLGEW